MPALQIDHPREVVAGHEGSGFLVAAQPLPLVEHRTG